MSEDSIQYQNETPNEYSNQNQGIQILVPEQENELSTKILRNLALSNALIAFISLFMGSFWILQCIIYYTWPLGIIFMLAYISSIAYFQLRTKQFLDHPLRTQLALGNFALKVMTAVYFTYWLNFINIRLPLYILMNAFIYQYLKENDVSWERSDLIKQASHVGLLILLLVMLSHGKETVLLDLLLLPIFCCAKSIFIMSMIGKIQNYEYLKKENTHYQLCNLHSDSEQIFFCELFSCSKIVT